MLLIQVIVLVRIRYDWNFGFLTNSNLDMDCDGLKKSLLTDTDGSLFEQPTTVFSQAEYLWSKSLTHFSLLVFYSFYSGDQSHGVGDYRIPSIALSNLTGHKININASYPYRGRSRSSNCIYQSS